MKKKWAYLAATMLLTGCAEDAFEGVNMQDTTERQEIKLSAGTTGISVASRGVGAIGSTDAANNVWGNQTVYVWSFKRGLTQFNLNAADRDEDGIYLKAEAATTTQAETTSALAFTNGTIFYPLTNAYHFVGYYIDDITDPIPDLDATTGDILLPIIIDGTQDVMIANSQLSNTQKTTLIEALKTNGKISYTTIDEVIYTTDDTTNGTYKAGDPIPNANSDTDELITAEYNKAFSSYTARRDIQPNLVFEHKLAKLNFKIKAGDAQTIASVDNSDPVNPKNLGVYITNIGVSSLTTGNIRIKNNGQIDFTDAATEGTLYVGSKDNNGKINTTEPRLTPTGDQAPATGENDPDQVGEGLLVIPAETYTAQVTVKQEYDRNGNYITDTNEQTKTYNDVEINITDGFKAGHSYDIIITVYSNQEINITATLTGWLNGGSVNITPEDNEFNESQNSSNSQTPTNP